jgi:undecaprenyl-diphosphatase
MISIFEAIILGIVQGLTEWLPISSSAHLALVQTYFGMSVPVAYDVLLHLGTALVILIVFRSDVLNIIRSVYDTRFAKYRPMVRYIVIGSFATGIIGLFGNHYFKSLFSRPSSIGAALILTSVFLFGSKTIIGKKSSMNNTNALLIGCVQGFAIIPGVSRSGTTIATGLMRGIDRSTAATFSFLLSLPAVLGAAIIEFDEFIVSDISLMASVVGTLTAIIVGYGSLKILLKLVHDNRFHYLGWYCLLLGIIVVSIG